MRKFTMKDIAREAGVSVATVSYILNKAPGQSISEETRQRVQEIASRLHYVPSLTARSLVKGKSGMLALLYSRSDNDSQWKQLYYGALCERMEALCKAEGYHLLVMGVDADQPKLDIIQQREIDGVLLVDVKKEVFPDISVHFHRGVPVVLLDSIIEDPLFHKVVLDYPAAFQRWREQVGEAAGGGFLIMGTRVNEELNQEMISASGFQRDHIFVLDTENEKELPRFLERFQGHQGVVINEFAALPLLGLSRELQLELTVMCTSGYPQLLPPEVRTLQMETGQPHLAAALELIKHYIQSGSMAEETVTDGHAEKQPFKQYITISLT
ncbi:LacI family DNA-binding transcriptional regulator [Paenibacillus algicola]|nr:LacI family DNA-binding transcriptional regulator [Paenibacillus algicola]